MCLWSMSLEVKMCSEILITALYNIDLTLEFRQVLHTVREHVPKPKLE